MRKGLGLAMAAAGLVSLVPAALAQETLPDGFPTRRGPFVFTSASILASSSGHEQEIGYLSRFDVILTNGFGIAPRQTREQLQAKGCRLFLYFWTNGAYAEGRIPNPPMGEWCEQLVAEPEANFIGGSPLPSLAGKPAFYYDLTSSRLVERLCSEIAAARADTGYDGVFFDYAGQYALPPEVLQAWRQEHPGVSYDRCLLRLFTRLRQLDPGCLIFTNQAYRSTEPLLRAVDYDLAESLATSFAWGPETEVNGERIAETYFRPWPGEFGIEGQYGEPEARATEHAPRLGLLYLDYSRPRFGPGADGSMTQSLDLEATYYSYCAAALWGRDGYCSGWYAGQEYRGPLHFADLGAPLGEGPIVRNGTVFREYERGLVAITAEAAPASLRLPVSAEQSFYDLFTSEWIEPVDGVCELRLEPGTRAISGQPHPVGRVYLKASRDLKER